MCLIIVTCYWSITIAWDLLLLRDGRVNILFQFRVVKLSSPYLNVLIVIGVIMYYVDVILFGVDEGTPASRCTVNVLCMVSYNGFGKP